MLAEAALAESFREMHERHLRERAALLATYPQESGTHFAIFRLGANTELWLHRSLLHPGGWRVTSRDTRPEWAHLPFSGHTEHPTFEEALKDLAGDRAVFVSRNVDPVLHDPSMGFRRASNADLIALREERRQQIRQDRERGGVNIPMHTNFLFAVEQEMRRRRLPLGGLWR